MELQKKCDNSVAASIDLVFKELQLILDNWVKGYLRVLDEKGVDWSAPHEFFDEFFHMMCPYIDALHKRGYTRLGLMRGIGDKIVECLELIVQKCEQEEDLLRLTGQWTDLEQEIKDHWFEQAKALTNAMRTPITASKLLCSPEECEDCENCQH